MDQETHRIELLQHTIYTWRIFCTDLLSEPSFQTDLSTPIRSQKSTESTKIGFWSSSMRDFEVDGHELNAKFIMIKHEYILQYFWHSSQV